MSLYDHYQFFKQAWFSGKPIWQTSDMPDLSGKVIIVTGGGAGIGKGTVQALLEHNAKVYIATRNQASAEAAIKELKALTGKDAHFIHLDLEDLPSVRKAAEEFLKQETRLDVLFNNAGVMMPPVEKTTPAGYDLSFGVNVLGHFFFTKLLLPIMMQTSKTTGIPSRIVTTSSGAHYLAKYDFNAFKDGPARKKMNLIDLYGQSKWGNIVFANEVARRYGDKGIVSCSVNPGNLHRTETNLARHVQGGIEFYLLKMMQIYPLAWGILPQLYAGTSPDGADFNGKFVVPWGWLAPARSDTTDPQIGKELWTWLEEQVKDI
ncbi:hypothetical protein BDZ94DRAFT_1307286 [Collybia nuda]|uniref:NAD(P)-binding protein n=1 Tax=Collybia nuda TaxID=64659 RepID=A0A9P5YCG8_9AGAR|nr:hypothetical protein BDZ94DRAFT_1307286 [Collybia nuda]